MANVALTEDVVEKDIALEIGGNKAAPKFASQLPEAKGFKLLIALPEIEEMTDGGIIRPEDSRHEESIATVVGCAFSGTRIKIHGKEFRLINDDTVEAVVEDPRGVERA